MRPTADDRGRHVRDRHGDGDPDYDLLARFVKWTLLVPGMEHDQPAGSPPRSHSVLQFLFFY